MYKILGLAIFLSSWLLSFVYADTIKLSNGNTIEGTILEKTDKYVRIQSEGASVTYYLDQIVNINNQALVSGLNNEQKEAAKILEKAKSVYGSLDTYKTHGNVVMDMGTSRADFDFNMVLKKPNLYLLSWLFKGPMGTGGHTDAVWSDGTQPYVYMGGLKSYSKMDNDTLALSTASGISTGLARTIPSIFLPGYKAPVTILDQFDKGSLAGEEKVDNEDCYVIKGDATSFVETLWISKSNYFIKRYSHSLGASQRTSTENYLDISTPGLNAQDFEFKIPEGADLKQS